MTLLDDDIWTTEAVAEYLHTTPSAVHNLRYRGEGPPAWFQSRIQAPGRPGRP